MEHHVDDHGVMLAHHAYALAPYTTCARAMHICACTPCEQVCRHISCENTSTLYTHMPPTRMCHILMCPHVSKVYRIPYPLSIHQMRTTSVACSGMHHASAMCIPFVKGGGEMGAVNWVGMSWGLWVGCVGCVGGWVVG